jgi:hypothetical protein
MASIRFNCPDFIVSRFLTVTRVFPILSNTHLVIIGDNTTVLGNTKTTIFIMDLERVVVSTTSMDSRCYKSKRAFVDLCVAQFKALLSEKIGGDEKDFISNACNAKIIVEAKEQKPRSTFLTRCFKAIL